MKPEFLRRFLVAFKADFLTWIEPLIVVAHKIISLIASTLRRCHLGAPLASPCLDSAAAIPVQVGNPWKIGPEGAGVLVEATGTTPS